MAVELYEVCYMMEEGTGPAEGLGYWRLSGIVANHPKFGSGHRILVSNLVSFDKKKKLLKTASGRQYQIKSWGNDPTTVIAQIKKDIAVGGYEVHNQCVI